MSGREVFGKENARLAPQAATFCRPWVLLTEQC
jgi:hypothetical protein